jgi:hypothetical protein
MPTMTPLNNSMQRYLRTIALIRARHTRKAYKNAGPAGRKFAARYIAGIRRDLNNKIK